MIVFLCILLVHFVDQYIKCKKMDGMTNVAFILFTVHTSKKTYLCYENRQWQRLMSTRMWHRILGYTCIKGSQIKLSASSEWHWCRWITVSFIYPHNTGRWDPSLRYVHIQAYMTSHERNPLVFISQPLERTALSTYLKKSPLFWEPEEINKHTLWL